MPQLAPELTAGQISARLTEGLGNALIEVIEAHGQVTARVRPENWVDAARFLKDDETLACKFFSWLSAIDWTEHVDADATLDAEPDDEADAPVNAGEPTPVDATPAEESESAIEPFPADHIAGTYAQPRGELFQVIAMAEAPERGYGVVIKTELPREEATIASLTEVYAGANWHERECHEMFGISFDGHPGLAPLYLPEDFEGHPLLKSFKLGAREIKPWPGIVDVEEIPADLEEILDARARGGAPADEVTQ